MLAVIKAGKECRVISQWNAVRDDLFMTPVKIKLKYNKLYPDLSTNGKFLLDMGEHLSDIGDTENAIKVLEASKQFYISYRTFLSTANTYYQSGNIASAINNLEELSNMIPSRFYPKYELAKLCYESGDTIKGDAMARLILSMPVKKLSSDVNDMRNEVTRMLNLRTPK